MTPSRQQFFMAAGFNDAAFVHNVDDIRLQGRGKAVGDDQCGTAGDQPSKPQQPVRFRPGIHGAGGFIQDDQSGVSQKCPRKGQALPLAPAQFGATEPFAQNGFISCRQTADRCIRPGSPCRRLDPPPVRTVFAMSPKAILLKTVSW